MEEWNVQARLVVNLILSAIVITAAIILVVLINGNHQGIDAVASMQEQQQFEMIEEMDGAIMSGAAVSTVILENSNKYMGFSVNGVKYMYDYDQHGDYYDLDLEVYHGDYVSLDPRLVYKANVKYNKNGVPIYIVFEEQVGVS